MTRPLVVVGDVMLDVDRCGTVERLSPEAPVPVLRDPTDTRRPGGAALAALLAARSSSRPVVLIAPLSGDDAARRILELIGDQIEVIALDWTGSTPVKTRLRAGNHPIARIDEGGTPGVFGALPPAAQAALASAATVLVADYGVGLTAFEPLRDALQAISARTPIIWDPHPLGADPVPDTWCVTPNETELRMLSTTPGSRERSGARNGRPSDDIARSAEVLAEQWSARAVCVTLGSRGAVLWAPGSPPLMVPTSVVPGGDTCGAGDSFAAALALAAAGAALPSEAVISAVEAAGSFVASGGAAAFDPTSPHAGTGWRTEPPAVERLLAEVRRRGGTVVATGGCFDLLHAGHVATLQAARGLGDALVVCLNSDASVRRLKGEGRPLQPQQDRSCVLTALECVDAVVVFDEQTPSSVLERIRPDVWVKGGDYSGLDLPEAAVLEKWGGQIVTVPYVAGRSTSALVELASAPAR